MHPNGRCSVDPCFHGVRGRRAKRVVKKNGDRNVTLTNVPARATKYFRDVVTTMIDAQWRFFLTIFSMSYLSSWFIFAICWYLISYTHGDLTKNSSDENVIKCVVGCQSFADFFLLSVKTQVSIGYGAKYVTEECPEGVFLITLQVIVGIGIHGAMASIVYAKMVKPSKHISVMNFSKKAVICQRDSKLCLIFRICDINYAHVIGTKITAFWFEERFSPEGEKLKNLQHTLTLQNDGNVFLIFPTTICHVINESSPLYNLTQKQLNEKKFELLVSLTGSSRSTGQLTQCRTSYLPKEILWGYRFVNIVSYNSSERVDEVDYDKFDDVIEYDTPTLSARELNDSIEESESDVPSAYYNENLNYIGHCVTEDLDKLTDLEAFNQPNGLVRSQSEQYTIRLQSTSNERPMSLALSGKAITREITSDGIIRVARVKTAKGELTRSLKRLIPLEIADVGEVPANEETKLRAKEISEAEIVKPVVKGRTRVKKKTKKVVGTEEDTSELSEQVTRYGRKVRRPVRFN